MKRVRGKVASRGKGSAFSRALQEANLSEILFEFHKSGNYVRVVAIDPKSGVEVTMVGSVRYGAETLKRNAARKLAYVILNKKGMAAPGKGGILA